VSERVAPIPFDQAAYNVTLPAFEGPLDLLLHLIHKHELDIFDIPIAFITEKYLQYLAVMQSLNLDVAAEYLLMVATLAHIKSRELLPSAPPEEAAADGAAGEIEEDPRAALVRRLLEYQKFKAAAEELAARGVAGRDVFPRGANMADEVSQTAPLEPVPLFSLLEALQRIAARKKVTFGHEVTAERVSISERITELVDLLRGRRTAMFEELFAADRTTTDMVVTFLALLEMTRLKMTRLYQAGPLEAIHVTLTLSDTEPIPTVEDVP
jgi:segregation and condensation protein A